MTTRKVPRYPAPPPAGPAGELEAAAIPADARPIPGADGYYITPSGVVWSMNRGRPHPLRSCRRRYEEVGIRVDGCGVTKRIHVMVALVFLGPRPPGMEINHRDGNKRNNSVANLEYVTPAENHEHALRSGLGSARKFADTDVFAARFMRACAGYPWPALARCFEVTEWTVRKHVYRAERQEKP